ncbi:MAG: D-sedoheptulose 7-phosphate isomerase [Sphingobacteriaceae bacterium]
MVIKELQLHQEVVEKVITSLVDDIEVGCEIITDAILHGKKILLAGNGGSAADAQHIAAEFTGRFVKERKPLAAIALNTDTSALTSIGNDYGYEYVFDRQVQALAQPGDVLIAISTSGNSPSILRALTSAERIGCKTIGLSGKGGGKMTALCDLNIVIPDDVTARIQEMHILIGHIFCKSVDDLF